MNIHEYQAKKILKEYGAPISKGIVIFKEKEIDKKLAELKGSDSGRLIKFVQENVK